MQRDRQSPSHARGCPNDLTQLERRSSRSPSQRKLDTSSFGLSTVQRPVEYSSYDQYDRSGYFPRDSYTGNWQEGTFSREFIPTIEDLALNSIIREKNSLKMRVMDAIYLQPFMENKLDRCIDLTSRMAKY